MSTVNFHFNAQVLYNEYNFEHNSKLLEKYYSNLTVWKFSENGFILLKPLKPTVNEWYSWQRWHCEWALGQDHHYHYYH